MAHHDLVIIGSGSGNSLVTSDFAGKSVAVIEAGRFGGTCLNVGCIPTKMFVYAADVARSAREASRLGVDARVDGVRWGDIRDRVFGRIDPISAAGQDYRERGPGTTAYLGWARFVGDRRLEVALHDGGVTTVTGDQVVIATGSHPVIPDVVTRSGVPFHTSDTIMRLNDLPERVLILGGGYIAAEFAGVFSAFGSAVTIATRGDRLLKHLDADIGAAFNELAAAQWDVRYEAVPTALERTADGIRATLPSGDVVEADVLLVATGRAPSTDDLGCSAAGVVVSGSGSVVVDEYGRTSAPGVWSLGDVSSVAQLKHVANHEARVVAHNLVHPEDLRAFDHRFIPYAVFTHPQVASVGLTEAEARAAGHAVVTAMQRYGDTAYGWAMEDTTSLVKLVADRQSGSLIGAHLMGPQSSSLIQPLVQAMSTGQPVAGLARAQYWIHPALAEVVENAILGLGFES